MLLLVRGVETIIDEYYQKAAQLMGSQLNFLTIKIEKKNGIKMLV